MNKNILKIVIPFISSILVVIVIVIVKMDWGTVESEVKKTDIVVKQKEGGIDTFHDITYFDTGMYNSTTAEKDNVELLFNIEGLKKTTGRFNDFEVYLNVDGDSSSLEVNIQANSIFTNNKMRDESLVSDEFFNANKYPEIKFKSTSIIKSDTCMIAAGMLDFIGQQNALSIPFNVLGEGVNDGGNFVYIIEGRFEFDRTKFGMPTEKGIGDIVSISFYCEFDML